MVALIKERIPLLSPLCWWYNIWWSYALPPLHYAPFLPFVKCHILSSGHWNWCHSRWVQHDIHSLLVGRYNVFRVQPVMPQFANESSEWTPFLSLSLSLALQSIDLTLISSDDGSVGINQMQYGLVISVMGLTRLFMNVPAGLWTDRYGRKFTLVGGPTIAALGTLIMSRFAMK